MDNSFSTPVLLLIFNRPEKTQEIFNQIRKIKPANLFVSADGPRTNKNEENKCIAAREIVNEIDWECTIRTNFNEINLGCKKAVSSGIDWFFSQVEEGIILEDDCLPDLSFFSFCSDLLARYRDDERIMHIGGTNFQDGIQRGEGSYYFSRLVHVWGWATWKRAWDKYDVDIKSYEKFLKNNIINEILLEKKQREYWLKIFENVYTGRKDTWDFQWNYTLIINNGLSVIPNTNLVSNIGFGSEATHTYLTGSPASKMKTGIIKEIIHPEFIFPFKSADDYTYKQYMIPGKMHKLLYLIRSKLTS